MNEDHRDIGRRLKLFHFQYESQGGVFWLPRGYALYRVIEDYIRSKISRAGYEEVRSPQVFSKSLWEKSGHWEHFSDNMFAVGDDHVLKPMNCPGHVQMFNAQTPSYRQLPMRLAEFGCCHRNEPSGALLGVMRVRQFVQDDAHIFCQENQIESEVKAFCELLLEVYEKFGFNEVKVGLSLRPDNRAGSDELWDKAERALASAVDAVGLQYALQPGEGAFYGPKLEFALVDANGREWQCGTVQLDFVLPERLGARYIGEDGMAHVPVMIHRAILGSLERFVGILLEHYQGNLPVWLSPVQVVVMSIKPEANDYAMEFHAWLEDRGVRAKLDIRDENVSQKIKEHSELAVPLIMAVGAREITDRNISVRVLGEKGQSVMNWDEAFGRIIA
jgi:threonyl-tRNA synthetase